MMTKTNTLPREFTIRAPTMDDLEAATLRDTNLADVRRTDASRARAEAFEPSR